VKNISPSERIKEERIANNYKTQADIANKLNITRETWGRYERGLAIPNGDVLLFLSKLGFDIGYIFSGSRSNELLSEDEKKLLSAWRSADFSSKFEAFKILQESSTS
jgi:transcriptional regulator with XRE-family HTH domain